MMHDRRFFLGLAALAPLAVATLARGQTSQTACYDPATLPLSQKSRRRSLEYVDLSGDPARQCGICSFFTVGTNGCGSCQILGGGSVAASGVCSSFAARAGK